MKYNIREFDVKISQGKLKPEYMKEYLTLKKKALDKRTDEDKNQIKFLRTVFKTQVYDLKVKHKRSLELTEERICGEKVTYAHIKAGIKSLITSIQSKRKKLKEPGKIERRHYYGFDLQLSGGVHIKPEMVLEAHKKNNKNSSRSVKKPVLKTNYIGIELEFNDHRNVDAEDIHEMLSQKGLGKYTNLTRDGSCGHELRVLLQEKDYEGPLKLIMDSLKEMGFSCNASCGTHVHLDMRNRDAERAYHNFVHVQDVMFKLVNKNRRTNSYCKKNVLTTFERARQQDRFVYANASAYDRHKTIEIRLHHGTLDFDEMNTWIKLLLKVANFENKIEKPVSKMIEMSRALKFSKEEQVGILSKRYKAYNKTLGITQAESR